MSVTHRLKTSQYLILLAVMLTASIGDGLLKRGMGQVGAVDFHHLGLLWHALSNTYVIAGILLLIGFFASYMTALSFADLTFVMPATAMGFVVTALLSRYWLHEQLSPFRWAGIALIACGVGLVAGGPSRTGDEPALSSRLHELDIMDSGVGR